MRRAGRPDEEDPPITRGSLTKPSLSVKTSGLLALNLSKIPHRDPYEGFL